jgi:lysophospholipase L1-like esterase
VGLAASRRAHFALAAGSVLATLLLGLLAYEVVANVRYCRWRARYNNKGWLGRLTIASPDPGMIWEYRPNAHAAGITTNRWGFRDIDYPESGKPVGVERVAFVGDSVTLGLGVAPERTFVRVLEQEAAFEGLPLQALNFGVDGYNALQVRALLERRALAFEPDQVVYMLCLNDFDFEDSSGMKIAYFRRPWFFFPLELERRWRALTGVEYHRYYFRKNARRVFQAVSEMRDLLTRRRTRVLVVIVPIFPEQDGGPDYFARYPLRDLHRAIASSCQERGIAVHDLLDDFSGKHPRREALDVWHLSPEGHRTVAQALLPLLAPSRFPVR